MRRDTTNDIPGLADAGFAEGWQAGEAFGRADVERELQLLVAESIGANEGCPYHYGNAGYSCSCSVDVRAIENIIGRWPAFLTKSQSDVGDFA